MKQYFIAVDFWRSGLEGSAFYYGIVEADLSKETLSELAERVVTRTGRLAEGWKYTFKVTAFNNMDSGPSYKFYGSNGFHYTTEGSVYFSGGTSLNDLVKEWVKPDRQEGHIHAKLIHGYAQDALISKTPWEGWEFTYDTGDSDWDTCSKHPVWDETCRYRRKPKTLLINDYEVPESLRVAPPYNTWVYVVDLTNKDNYVPVPFGFNEYAHKQLLDKGLVHLDKEAAQLHAKALLSFTTTVQEKP